MEQFPNGKLFCPSDRRSPFIFSSPHSGQIYPPSFLKESRLNAMEIRRSEDFLVDEIFSAAPSLGAPLLAAQIARAFLDLNREPYELDPAMFEEALPAHANKSSVSVSAGLGTIARIVAEDMEIYDQPLSYSEAEARIQRYYFPYHQALRRLADEAHGRFGCAIVIDCHSMPSARSGKEGADIIIGNRYQSSASEELSRQAAQILTEMGYCVRFNRPYSGGFITKAHGVPARGFHALQIELNRALYMDEARMEKSAGFATLTQKMRRFIEALVNLSPSFYDDFLYPHSKKTAL